MQHRDFLNKNNVIKFTLVALMTMLIMLLTPTISANAEEMGSVTLDSNDKITVTNNGTSPFTKSNYETKADASSDSTPVFKVEGTKVTINSSFNDLTTGGQRKALKDLIDVMSKSSVSQQGQQDVIDMIRGANPSAGAVMVSLTMSSTNADMFTALKWAEPFMPIINFILGVLVLGIFIILLLSTTADLAYMGFPLARSFGDNNQKENGKVPFISWDAQSVVKEVESSIGGEGGYKNAYLIYLKRRIVTYIVLAFCILYLVAGDLGTLIGWLLSLGSGILGN